MPKASLDYATVSAKLAIIAFNFLCTTKYANNSYGPVVNYNGNGQLCVFLWGEGYCCNCNELRRLGTFYARLFWHLVAEMLLAM
jgi:hypothetical protein